MFKSSKTFHPSTLDSSRSESATNGGERWSQTSSVVRIHLKEVHCCFHSNRCHLYFESARLLLRMHSNRITRNKLATDSQHVLLTKPPYPLYVFRAFPLCFLRSIIQGDPHGRFLRGSLMLGRAAHVAANSVPKVTARFLNCFSPSDELEI